MLDLSAAFDTIDHAFQLSRLPEMYGMHDQTLIWIRFYLSDTQKLSFGVLQRSLLGPICTACKLNLCRAITILQCTRIACFYHFIISKNEKQ